jgi:hypothetical protein
MYIYYNTYIYIYLSDEYKSECSKNEMICRSLPRFNKPEKSKRIINPNMDD